MPDILRALPQISMEDRTLITTGAVGSVLAAIRCATPILAIVLGCLVSGRGCERLLRGDSSAADALRYLESDSIGSAASRTTYEWV